jgi:hypothetical protein
LGEYTEAETGEGPTLLTVGLSLPPLVSKLERLPRDVAFVAGEAGPAGRRVQVLAADQFAASVFPVLQTVRQSGASSLAEIASALNTRGVRSASGGKWHRSAVRNLLVRPQHCAG